MPSWPRDAGLGGGRKHPPTVEASTMARKKRPVEAAPEDALARASAQAGAAASQLSSRADRLGADRVRRFSRRGALRGLVGGYVAAALRTVSRRSSAQRCTSCRLPASPSARSCSPQCRLVDVRPFRLGLASSLGLRLCSGRARRAMRAEVSEDASAGSSARPESSSSAHSPSPRDPAADRRLHRRDSRRSVMHGAVSMLAAAHRRSQARAEVPSRSSEPAGPPPASSTARTTIRTSRSRRSARPSSLGFVEREPFEDTQPSLFDRPTLHLTCTTCRSETPATVEAVAGAPRLGRAPASPRRSSSARELRRRRNGRR